MIKPHLLYLGKSTSPNFILLAVSLWSGTNHGMYIVCNSVKDLKDPWKLYSVALYLFDRQLEIGFFKRVK